MKTKGYLIGNAHIDPVWLWDRKEGLTEVRNTFRSALDRLSEMDEWIFTASSASYYMWIEEIDPQMFEEIRMRVKEGRWNIVGGWWVQPDCNIPSGESFCRQALYGQRYFLEKFGIKAEIGYNVDSFGHNAGLPQILCKSGLKFYIFSRPNAHEMNLPPTFNWVGLDGSAVRAARIPIGYESNTLRELKEKTQKFERLREQLADEQLLFYGVGNHGGGPTIEMIEWLREVKEEKNFVFSSLKEYFAATGGRQLKSVAGDLSKHAVGCYSADSAIKMSNRKAENSLLSAEKFACLARHVTGAEYPLERLREMWKLLLFYQFHDSLGGCSIRRVCEDAVIAMNRVINECDEIINFSLQKISSKISTCGGLSSAAANRKLGKPVVVFNPNAVDTTCSVRISRLCVQPDENFKSFEAYSSDGLCVPVQLTYGENLFWYVRDGLFRAEIPAFGYRLFYIRECAEGDYDYNDVSAVENKITVPEKTYNLKFGDIAMENDFIRVVLDKENGVISDLENKENRIKINCEGMRFSVDDDRNFDTWGHRADGKAWEKSNALGVWGCPNGRLGEEIGRFDCWSVKIVERSAVRSVVRAEFEYNKSQLICDYILYSDADYLETEIHLNWQEKQRAARMVFPYTGEQVECETCYGHIAKQPNFEEEFAHKWIDFGDSKSGITLINDGIYSYRVTDSEAAAMLARSAIYADHAGVKEKDALYGYQDFGEIKHRFIIKPRAQADFSGATQTANCFNQPCAAIWEGYHGGELGGQNSFISVSEPNVSVKVVKLAENGGGYVLRAYETDGKNCDCRIDFFGKTHYASFAPFEIKTIFCDRDKFKELDILEFD